MTTTPSSSSPNDITVGKVFIAGGQPTFTYVRRQARQLEEAVQKYFDTLHKILSISGPTKCGKTVLIRRITAGMNKIAVTGGQVTSLDTFWSQIIEKANAFTEVAITEQTESSGSSTDTTEIGASALGATAKMISALGTTGKAAGGSTFARKSPPTVAGPRVLADVQVPLIIDDFHYIESELQMQIIRGLKDLVFDGLPVILMSVPHRAYDAVRVEREMTGRIEVLRVPEWTDDELLEIPTVGFETLNVSAESSITGRLVSECFKSPHLMQDFCGELCRGNSLKVRPDSRTELKAPDWTKFFSERAAGTAKTAFDRLVVGPRQRQDRMQRRLKDGGTCDIYVAVLLALAHGGPRTTSSYEEIRNWLREILDDDLPQAHEVTAVLQHMANIARTEIAGEPVIDYDRDLRRVFLADPFFAYYLRWGADTARLRNQSLIQS